MIINLNDKMRIASDTMNWKVQKKQLVLSGPRKGTVDWISVFFCSTAKRALDAAWNLGLKEIEGDDPEKILAAIENMKQEFKTSLDALDHPEW